MIKFPFLDETHSEFSYPENIDVALCIRHSLLFCTYEGVLYAIIPEAQRLAALQLYNKLSLTYPIAHLSHSGY